MVDESKDAGLIQVMAAHLEMHQLPMALSLKEKVDRGETLNEFDIEFLEEIMRETQEGRALLERHPEWHEVIIKLIRLYKDITSKALENEQLNGSET